MWNKILIVAAFVGVGTVFLSCDSDEAKTYDVPITWNIGGIENCTTAAIPQAGNQSLTFQQVVVAVYDEEGDPQPLEQPFPASCNDFGYTIPRLERGTYFVTLDAMASLDGDYLGYFHGEGLIEAPAEDENGYAFPLSLGTGSVNVSWSFENGKMCGANNVEMVRVTIVDESEDIPCNDGEYLVEDLQWNNYSLTVKGYDAEGNETWSGTYEENPFLVKPGVLLEPNVVLSEI